MRAKIEEAVDEEWLAEIQDPILGLVNVTPLQMLKHLDLRGGDLDFIKIMDLKRERDAPWDHEEHITTYFSHIKQAVTRL